MSVQFQVLRALENSKGKSISGSDLAKKLCVSRNTVWKAIQQLKKDGYQIEAVTNKGYCLCMDNDIVSAQSIAKYLNNDLEKLRIEVYDSVLSTNTMMKKLAENGESEGKVIIANEQTMGRGRKGRSFYSPSKTGIYMSVLLRPKLNVKNSLLITTAAAVSVANAIEKFTSKPVKIKWVNDVFYKNKKICGILTEASLDFETGGLSYVVLGIGINILNPEAGFPNDLKKTATFLLNEQEYTSEIKSQLIAAILNNFFGYYKYLTDRTFMDEYRKRSLAIGNEVDIVSDKKRVKAFVLDIDNDAQLVVKFSDGVIKSLSSGEISIRIGENEHEAD